MNIINFSHRAAARAISLSALATLLAVSANAQIPTLVPPEMVLDSPHKFSGCIVSKYAADYGFGSGVMAVHPKYVITAAHVVFDGMRKHLPPPSNLYLGYPNPLEVRWFPARHKAWGEVAFVDDFKSGSLLRSSEIPTTYASGSFQQS